VTDLGEFEFDCEITRAVNPVSYEEVELTPPVRISTWEQYDLFYDRWERFCRDAADRGVDMRMARFDL
jgi:hypothetical protein